MGLEVLAHPHKETKAEVPQPLEKPPQVVGRVLLAATAALAQMAVVVVITRGPLVEQVRHHLRQMVQHLADTMVVLVHQAKVVVVVD